MAPVDHLPTEILLRIFSYLQKFELLAVEKVCVRWKTVISCVWTQLSRITMTDIGYPDYDFMNNFMKIIRRVRRVEEPLAGVVVGCSFKNLNPDGPGKLKAALLQMVKKRTSDAILPLELCKDILKLVYPPNKPAPELSSTQARYIATKALNEFELCEFTAISIEKVEANSFEDKHHMFNTCFQETTQVEIPVNKCRIKQISISTMEVLIGNAPKKTLTSAKNNVEQLSQLSSLEMVGINSIVFLLFSFDVLRTNPDVHLNIDFASLQFNREQFQTFLETCTQASNLDRSQSFAELMEEWKRNGSMQRAELRVSDEELDRIKSLFDVCVHHRHEAHNNVMRNDPVCVFIDSIFPAFFTFLHLLLADVKDENQLLTWLQKKNVYCRMVESALFFSEYNEKKHEKHVSWEESHDSMRVVAALRRINRGLRRFGPLTFRFTTDEKAFSTLI